MSGSTHKVGKIIPMEGGGFKLTALDGSSHIFANVEEALEFLSKGSSTTETPKVNETRSVDVAAAPAPAEPPFILGDAPKIKETGTE